MKNINIEELIEISFEIGRNPAFVQGAGGNTSVKNSKEMFVKASGKHLARAKDENIFVSVEYKKIQENISKRNEDIFSGQVTDSQNRPSIETSLHALMPHKYVVHIHPIEIIPWLVKKKEHLVDKFLDKYNAVWINYYRPGFDLAQGVNAKLKVSCPDILLLENHGIVVGFNDSSSILEKLNEITGYFSLPPRELRKFEKDILKSLSLEIDYRMPKYDSIHSLANDPISFNNLSTDSGIIYPDQAIFMNHSDSIFDHCNVRLIKNKVEAKNPDFIVIKDTGVLISSKASSYINDYLYAHAEILKRISEQKIKYLNNSELSILTNWEPEKYRQQINK